MSAQRLGYIHADSGAIYRTMTLALMDTIGQGDSPESFGRIIHDAGGLESAAALCQIVLEDGKQTNRINGKDAGDRIRSPLVTARIRYVADNRACREAVNRLLQNFADETDLVADGRDMGTVVFTSTPWKFYLEASVRVRANRRLEEFRSKGDTGISLETLEKDIQQRDDQDKSRAFGALKCAPDAILIDTSELRINDVVARILSHLQLIF